MLQFLARLSQNLKVWSAFFSLAAKVGGRIQATAALRQIDRASRDGTLTPYELLCLAFYLGLIPTKPYSVIVKTAPDDDETTPQSSK